MFQELRMCTTITNLPFEVLSQIIRMLPPEDLKTVMLVCKAWKKMTEDPKLWTWLVVSISTIRDLKNCETHYRVEGLQLQNF